ncbi:hypothetical protein [Parvibaculum sp.]|uniref:hypothetical protein n=1 Tax=Parvibaculum sp. TaxID=2024848 RepID=UPI001DDF6A27|nr:hypothetical protein [Parvibaculum sp.]MBX3488890.1 hypothetical protein [Parvibaculum sp.]MCW5727228.1 hypothetical protein [Parvibaculum sp.]
MKILNARELGLAAASARARRASSAREGRFFRRFLIALASAGVGAIAFALAAQALGLGDYAALLFFAIAASVVGQLLVFWSNLRARQLLREKDHGHEK